MRIFFLILAALVIIVSPANATKRTMQLKSLSMGQVAKNTTDVRIGNLRQLTERCPVDSYSKNYWCVSFYTHNRVYAVWVIQEHSIYSMTRHRLLVEAWN